MIIHGGNEYYNLPSPKLKQRCQFFVDMGADSIICHHTHVRSGWEVYKNSPIFFGLGNFVFSCKSDKKGWYEGSLVELQFDEFLNKLEFKLHTVLYDISNNVVSLSETDDAGYYDELNKIINNEHMLYECWITQVNINKKMYLSTLKSYFIH